MKKKIMVAMSGGVDSSTAACILKEEGHEVTGVTMKLYDGARGRESLKSCCGFGPANDAKRVAGVLGIRHQVLDCRGRFKREVVDRFCGEYGRGRTPNPCVLCNARLKFDYLLKKAVGMGLDGLATGHYAQLKDGRLFKGADPEKDQSYFLYPINGANSRKIFFPVGNMKKAETRALARAHGLPVHEKKESQDICFVARGQYRAFVEKQGAGGARGYMLDTRGRIVGEHQGLHRYTVGQRKGLGPLGRRAYVVSMDSTANTLTVGEKADLLAKGLEAQDINACYGALAKGRAYDVRIRYRSAPVPGRITLLNGKTLHIAFERPVASVTPGQSMVLYRGAEVMGGGTISKAIH
jgi:tRNA-specific 2-thiouridylase